MHNIKNLMKYLLNMKKLRKKFNLMILLCVTGIFLLGCEFFALSFAPKKQPLKNNTELTKHAHKVFWETLHKGDYLNISKPMTLLKALYLQDPHNAKVAAHIGFLHAWRLSERQRLENIPPQITDDVVLARKFFGEAVKLDPKDARYLGFHSSMLMTEGNIHNDEYLIRKGYFQGMDSIDSWPQFNLFTIGYTMSSKDYNDPRFTEALEMQWKNIEVCIDGKIDRQNPDLSKYFHLEISEKREHYKRACWNSWIAPYNFQGFFMNLGDMIVKKGNSETAKKIYQIAKTQSDFKTWPYKDVLIRRIANSEKNVEQFRQKIQNSEIIKENAIMLNTPFSCTGCHEKG